MNRTEALNILGLDEDATAKDVKIAYKECVQILHPDRFANNKKLADRATEQFKRLQEAYEFLTTGNGGRTQSTPRRKHGTKWNTIDAQLAGLTAARTQLVAQKDALLDERRNALMMMLFGVIVGFLFRRVVITAAAAGALLIAGIVKLVSTLQSLSTINDHIKEIERQRRELEEGISAESTEKEADEDSASDPDDESAAKEE